MKRKRIATVIILILTVIFVIAANAQRPGFAVGGEWMPLMLIPIIKTHDFKERRIKHVKARSEQLYQVDQRNVRHEANRYGRQIKGYR